MCCDPMKNTFNVVALLVCSLLVSTPLTVLAEGTGSRPRDPVIQNCSEANKDAAKMAFKTVKSSADSTCISGTLATNLKSKLEERLTIQCITPDNSWLQTTWCDGNCGYGFPGDDMISICPGGFNRSGCGCLESVELHEFVHISGSWLESVSLECEKSCFPSCCVIPEKWKSSITGCGCK